MILFWPSVLTVDDEVGVQHAKALDHLVGAEAVLDDHEFGHKSVQQNCLD